MLISSCFVAWKWSHCINKFHCPFLSCKCWKSIMIHYFLLPTKIHEKLLITPQNFIFPRTFRFCEILLSKRPKYYRLWLPLSFNLPYLLQQPIFFFHECMIWQSSARSHYSKHPHIRTHNFGGQADWVIIYGVLNDKSASKCS